MLKLPTYRPLHELEEIEFYAVTIPAQASMAQLEPCTRLTSLKFLYSRPPEKFLMEVLTHTHITRLTLSGDALNAEAQAVLLGTHGRHLQYLELAPFHSVFLSHGTSLTRLETLKLVQNPSYYSPAGTLVNLLSHLPRLTHLEIPDLVIGTDIVNAFVDFLPRLRTLRLDATGASGKVASIDRLINELSLTSLSLCLRPLERAHVEALGSSKTLRYLTLYQCHYPGSCAPLARNTSLIWLDIASPTWTELELFAKSSTLTGLHLDDKAPKHVMAHIEENKQRITQWIRHDFFTSLLFIASQRQGNPSSVWRAIPLDIARHIFSFLAQPGKNAIQICGAVEFIFANIDEMWQYIVKTRSGIVLKESPRTDKSTFRWVPRRTTPTTALAPAPTPPVAAPSPPSSVSEKEEEKCNIC